jgi:hypothetical protein
MKQYEAVVHVLEEAGGVATLSHLYNEAIKIKDCKWGTKTPFATIRRIVQLNDNIYKIKRGLYGLKKYENQIEQNGIFVETEKNKNSKEFLDFNHTYYQGIIIEIGNFKRFNTFIPNQDRNKKYINNKLAEIRTLEQIPIFSFPELVKRSSTIDVIWFNERNMPHSFFEIEFSTDIQNSLLKYNDLQDFYSRMIIVSDKSRKDEYNKKIKYSSFKSISNRVKFLDFDILFEQYEQELKRLNYEVVL